MTSTYSEYKNIMQFFFCCCVQKSVKFVISKYEFLRHFSFMNDQIKLMYKIIKLSTRQLLYLQFGIYYMTHSNRSPASMRRFTLIFILADSAFRLIDAQINPNITLIMAQYSDQPGEKAFF